MKQFAERLRHLRTYKGLTLAQMAELLDTTKTTLSRYENDKRVPDADFIIKVSLYFKVSADYLLCLSNNPLSVEDLLTSKLANGPADSNKRTMPLTIQSTETSE
jgi:transcriptional regulator with XRE-family HTH domain